ncbi:hypothetical protein I4U23_027173 [Adineta vaga]|nr:hypothetical protein I4U23_027173 [Adineta vaga]
MQSIKSIDILRGHCDEISDVRSKVVRVFLSSTFSDTLIERDSLIDIVFPKLKDYCREKYRLEFQYVDMRWGIQTESSNNHSEVQICLREIELCKKYSIATNFVVLLSHRYGSRPIPATIPATLFELLYKVICLNADDKDDAQLLSQWYQLDSNCLPSIYVLRSISSVLSDILSSDTEKMKEAEQKWKKINNRIRTCLRQTAAKCFKQGQIQKDEYDTFFISITEKEIVEGILTASDANQRTLCFLREIENIHDHLSDSKVSKYIDMNYSTDGKPIVDSEAENLLNNLKYSRIPNRLQSSNIFSYKVHWTSNGINREDHSTYIDQFTKDFYRAIKEQIDQCVQSHISIVSDPLQHEILEHAIQCKTYVTKFHGRIDVLHRLKEYIMNETENRACIVYGDSGCGKTSVLAKTAIEVLKWWSNRSVSVILRFLGTTPSSSTIYKTLLSISEQICKLYNLSMEIYPDVLQLRHQLETNLFLKIPKNEYLIILLDSLDQLEIDAYDCQWLIKSFPKNIKCIISTLPSHGGILSNLKYILDYNQSSIENIERLLILVPPFEAQTVEIIYNVWLKVKQRSLSNEQRLFVQQWMKEQIEIVPLFMKLAFDIICTWHSYDPIDDQLKTCRNVDDCIRYLFNHLETKHNSILFRRALCYMTACRNGISQNELEDVLSLDDDVLKGVFEHYIPPIQRLPGILWTRIRNDMDEYITEKEVDDSSVIFWYHRRFIEVANEQFLSKLDETEKRIIFGNMIDLYNETWKGKNKPLKISNQKLIDKYHLMKSSGEIQANRLVASQPIEFIDVNGQVQYNKRKLNELPQFLCKLSPNVAIPIVVKEVFFNYPFMYAKIQCSEYNDITHLMQHFKEISTSKLPKEVIDMKIEINILFMVYIIIGHLLQEYPNNYAFEFSSRLLSLFGIKSYITDLLKQFDEKSIDHCALIVPYCQMRPPGSGLVYSMNKHTTSVSIIDITRDQMVAVTLSDRIIVIDMTSGHTSFDVQLPKLNEPYLNLTTINHLDEQSTKNSQQFYFLLNSFHHIYFISIHNDIKFERTSLIGYVTVEIFNLKRNLCIITEMNSNSVECWDLLNNRLFTRIDSIFSPIKTIFCIDIYSMIVILCQDGHIHFYSIIDWTQSLFTHRGTIYIDQQLNLIINHGRYLIYINENITPIDFVYIDLKTINGSKQFLFDQDIIKLSITFHILLKSKSIKRIVLPDTDKLNVNSLLCILLTDYSLYVIHKCLEKNLSYVCIDGHFDIVSFHENNRNTIYTARGGIIDIFVWKCNKHSMNEDHHLHTYELYVSIDISSSPITTIKPVIASTPLFLCSMENGAIHMYETAQIRKAYKQMPPFARTNNIIETVELYNEIAITLDNQRRELTLWSYQHSTSIESKRFYSENFAIDKFVLTSSKSDRNVIFVLIITFNNRIEIYSSQSFHNQPIFYLCLDSSINVHSTRNGDFLVLTNTGLLFSIIQQSNENQQIIFNKTNDIQLKTKCSMMFSCIITLDSIEHFVVLADDLQSMTIWTETYLIYINIDQTSYLKSRHLKSISTEQTQDFILLHFDNKLLILCHIELDESKKNGSIKMIPLDTIDMFSFTVDYLAAVNNEQHLLNLYNIRSQNHYKSIQLENVCEQMCLNTSGTYIFTLSKRRILLMYRINDCRQLAKLFLYDFVLSMKANNDFIVLAMNDRRLLTLMIADPNDSSIQEKIQRLPSRNSCREMQPATIRLVQHIERCAGMKPSHDDDDNDDDDDDDIMKESNVEFNAREESDSIGTIEERERPVSAFCQVRHFYGRYSPSNTNDTVDTESDVMNILSKDSKYIDTKFADVGFNEEDRVKETDTRSPSTTTAIVDKQHTKHDLSDIRRKVIEYDQQQLKGVQLANAGSQNLKVLNSHPITSNTCTLL